MKKLILSTLVAVLFFFTGCQDLDLNPLAEGSTENWYSNEAELRMSLDDLYRGALWYWECNRLFPTDRYSDDWSQREYVYDWIAGTYNGETSYVQTMWLNTYKAIARANTILISLDHAKGNISDDLIRQFEGEAHFFRAVFYSYLIFLWGDVPFYTGYLSIDEAFTMGRTDKNVILQTIYDDFDKAAEYLPKSYSSGLLRATKGAAYAFKARTATWMLDYATAATAAKSCMDLNAYSLHPDFGDLFLTKTRKSDELIFTIPRSKDLLDNSESVNSMYPRNPGGTATAQPSLELFCAFPCTDGLPIDESPLFSLQEPFKNRDPRCAYTCVEFGSAFLGFIYNPGVATVMNLTTNKSVTNQDSQLGSQYAAYSGMALKKGVDEEWTDDKATEKSSIIMRYADVLLMYAEAKMELNEIDASALNALNQVRARAYKCQVAETAKYPAVSETNQVKLRKIIRTERRCELAWENRRWFDIIRWRLIETVMQRPLYGLPAAAGLRANIASGDYFFPKGIKITIDENGCPDFTTLAATGKFRQIFERSVPVRQYLWPIPSKELAINKNLLPQNPGY
ncbi:MAG: RagB/SusD family nutrient uptake outer membrane protein [Candidatus Symbiothrix sp.]|nr:RagB/SusD family nutrient uptake outer membrane protein [Candidatus Symbiothrix sp.]